MHMKRKAERKLSTVSGVDILGGIFDTVEKTNKSIDKLPYYSQLEASAANTLESLSDKQLNDKLVRVTFHVVSLSTIAIKGKSLGIFLKNREMKTAGRIVCASMAVPMAAGVVGLAIEKRRRANLVEKPLEPGYIPIDELVRSVFADQNPNELHRLFDKK